MIKREFYMTRNDGINLWRTYSDLSLKIRQVETNAIYDEAIDVENSSYTYEETNTPIVDDSSNEEEKLADNIKQLLSQNLITLQDQENEVDYFNEHEIEPDYFNQGVE